MQVRYIFDKIKIKIKKEQRNEDIKSRELPLWLTELG
jgi:hypothetical protein